VGCAALAAASAVAVAALRLPSTPEPAGGRDRRRLAVD
jgi:hypothetical protein